MNAVERGYNASLKKAHGNTDVLLDKFIEGAREAGAETAKHYVLDFDIKESLGENSEHKPFFLSALAL